MHPAPASVSSVPHDPWHTLARDPLLHLLGTHAENGLAEQEAFERLKQYGENRLQESRRASAWKLLFSQFQNVLVIILLIATALSGFLGEEVEAITIAAIVLLAVVLGFVQEYRAENAMAALKEMAAPTAKSDPRREQGEIPQADSCPEM